MSKMEKAQTLKNFLTKHSHKLDYILGLLFVSYGVYGLLSGGEGYYYLSIIAGVISLLMGFFKPVRKFDNYMQTKIVTKK